MSGVGTLAKDEFFRVFDEVNLRNIGVESRHYRITCEGEMRMILGWIGK